MFFDANFYTTATQVRTKQLSTENAILKILPWQSLAYEDLKSEIWKEIPGLDEYYFISSFGRVKSIDRTIYTANGQSRCYKGRIHRLSIIYSQNNSIGDKTEELKVTIYYLGKCHNIRIARTVYKLFINDIEDKNMVVTHKDKNRFNNTVANLKLVTIQQKQKEVYDCNRGVKIFEYQSEVSIKKSAASRQKPVTQFNLQGLPIRSYTSISMASTCTKINTSSIVAAIKQKKMVSAGGYLWKYGLIKEKIDTTYYTEFINLSKVKTQKKVWQYNQNWKLVNMFVSIAEAEKKTGIHRNGISIALKSKYKLAGGFHWLQKLNIF